MLQIQWKYVKSLPNYFIARPGIQTILEHSYLYRSSRYYESIRATTWSETNMWVILNIVILSLVLTIIFSMASYSTSSSSSFSPSSSHSSSSSMSSTGDLKHKVKYFLMSNLLIFVFFYLQLSQLLLSALKTDKPRLRREFYYPEHIALTGQYYPR